MIRIDNESDVGVARRAARDEATAAGLGAQDVGRAALVATEAATNLARHARDGVIFVRRLEPLEGQGVEILSVDRGPGMADVARSMVDGTTTRGSPGQGLGAMRRMADTFVVDTHPGEGTVLAAQVRSGTAPPLTIGALTAGISDDGCGDAFAVERDGNTVRVIVIDGLGHGIDAAAAAEIAIDTFRERHRNDLPVLFRMLDEALKPTRGAALAVAQIDLAARAVRFMGVGNISGILISGGQSRNLVSHNGIVGHTMRRIQAFDYPFGRDLTLILHTDGINTRWKPTAFADRGLVHPAVIAGHLWRTETRGRDDVGVIVLRGGA